MNIKIILKTENNWYCCCSYSDRTGECGHVQNSGLKTTDCLYAVSSTSGSRVQNQRLKIMEEIELKTLLKSKDKVCIGKTLKTYRLSKGFSQKQLARELGSNFQKISKYESGKHHLPYDRLVKICEILNIEIIDFIQTDLNIGDIKGKFLRKVFFANTF